MKKSLHLVAILVSLAVSSAVSAQTNIFNHFSVGAELGTTGFGGEIAAPCTRYVTFRAGMTTMPRFSYSTDIDFEKNNGDEVEAEIKGKFYMTDFKFLVDVHPFTHSSFHVTVGAYFGKPNLVKVWNTNDITKPGNPNGFGPGEYIAIGNERVMPDANGTLRINLETSTFKPYVGLGFGRAVPKRNRVSCAFDLGVQFWGKPKLKAYPTLNDGWVEIKKGDIKDDTVDDIFDVKDKIVLYPVMNFRIYFRPI